MMLAQIKVLHGNILIRHWEHNESRASPRLEFIVWRQKIVIGSSASGLGTLENGRLLVCQSSFQDAAWMMGTPHVSHLA